MDSTIIAQTFHFVFLLIYFFVPVLILIYLLKKFRGIEKRLCNIEKILMERDRGRSHFSDK